MPFLSQDHIDRITKATGELERWIRTLPGLEESDFQTRAASSIARQRHVQVVSLENECTRLWNLVVRRNGQLQRTRKDHKATIVEAKRQAARADRAESAYKSLREGVARALDRQVANDDATLKHITMLVRIHERRDLL